MKALATMMALGVIGTVSVGCGARGASPITVVQRYSTGGEIALHGTVVAARHAAEDEMLAHCGGRAQILKVQRGPIALVADHGEAPPIDAERLHYVCVTRAARLMANRAAQ